MVTADEVRARLSERFTLTPMPDDDRGSAPAELFLVDGGPATVGIIASVSAPFCAACDRVRLTADGQVRNCLFAQGEVDLRGPLRDGASDDELAALIQGEMWRKAPRARHRTSRLRSSPSGRCPPSAAEPPEPRRGGAPERAQTAARPSRGPNASSASTSEARECR